MGWAYRSARGYDWIMRLMYGADYRRKLDTVSAWVPEGSVVVDLCCGTSAIADLLGRKNCIYTGLDIHPAFVDSGRRKGLTVNYWDGDENLIPSADVILLLSSLYQFSERASALIARIYAQARHRVIISEPIHNVTQSRNWLLQRLALQATRVRDKTFDFRFDESSIERVFAGVPDAAITRIACGRELVCVLEKRDGRA